jgi:pSer/pThr/pTyr-binding forkhead associated (FHA) protein
VEIQLLVKKGKTSVDALRIHHFPTVIGRHRECNLRIAARQVSRRHCALKARDGWLIVLDLDSCNGTLVNGRAIRGARVLHTGDQLEIGPIVFEVAYEMPIKTSKELDAGDTLLIDKVDSQLITRADEPLNAYELSEQLNEMDRMKSIDQFDTQRPDARFLASASDSGSKVMIIGDEVDSASRKLFDNR